MSAIFKPFEHPVASHGMDSGDGPPARSVCLPHGQLILPRHIIVGRQTYGLFHLAIRAPAPLDPRVADVHDHIRFHVCASTGTSASRATTPLTSCANPCPVTAETASTSL